MFSCFMISSICPFYMPLLPELFFPIFSSIFLRPGPGSSGQVICHCVWIWIYWNLCRLYFYTTCITKCSNWDSLHWENFFSLLSSKVLLEWGCNAAAVWFQIVPIYRTDTHEEILCFAFLHLLGIRKDTLCGHSCDPVKRFWGKTGECHGGLGNLLA